MKKLHKLYNKILSTGYQYKDKSRNVNCIQISDAKLKFDLTKGFPAVTTKQLYWKGVVGELLWFLRGDTNIKYLIENDINIWNKDAYNYFMLVKYKDIPNYKLNTFLKKVKRYEVDTTIYGDLGRIYGAQWRAFRGDFTFDRKEHRFMHGGTYPDNIRFKYLDQISKLIQNLKENPMNRRHIVTAWNPTELYDMALPPCHWAFEIIPEPIKTYKPCSFCGCGEGYQDPDCIGNLGENYWKSKTPVTQYQFTLKWHQRSVDSFLGLPFNIASYALLAHIIGKLTNMVPKTLIGDLSNVHIYEPHIDAVKEQLKREEYELPTLDIDSSVDFKDLESFLKTSSIDKFSLTNYKYHPAIKADMIAPNINNDE